jgi:hypothetical protein
MVLAWGVANRAHGAEAKAQARPPVSAPASHPPLDGLERKRLLDALKANEPGSLLIVCGGKWCRELADDLVAVFRQGSWKVNRVDSPGIGVDGVRGIRVAACAGAGAKIDAVLREATPRRIQHIDEGACAPGAATAIAVVLGQP